MLCGGCGGSSHSSLIPQRNRSGTEGTRWLAELKKKKKKLFWKFLLTQCYTLIWQGSTKWSPLVFDISIDSLAISSWKALYPVLFVVVDWLVSEMDSLKTQAFYTLKTFYQWANVPATPPPQQPPLLFFFFLINTVFKSTFRFLEILSRESGEIPPTPCSSSLLYCTLCTHLPVSILHRVHMCCSE